MRARLKGTRNAIGPWIRRLFPGETDAEAKKQRARVRKRWTEARKERQIKGEQSRETEKPVENGGKGSARKNERT